MQTRVGDLLMIYKEDKLVGYARVEDIVADVKPNWWQITLLILQAPPAKITWILREEYIDGGQFTMGGEAMRLELLAPPAAASPLPPQIDPEPEGDDDDDGGGSKVVSLADRRKKS